MVRAKLRSIGSNLKEMMKDPFKATMLLMCFLILVFLALNLYYTVNVAKDVGGASASPSTQDITGDVIRPTIEPSREQPAVQPSQQPPAKTPLATVALFVMSQCPYGTIAEAEVSKVVEKLGDDLKFELYFIANEQGSGFASLHGQPEVDEDLRQVCIIKHSSDKLFDYLACANKDYKNVGTIWEKCAKDAGIDADKIKTCAAGDEGKSLLRENIKKANALDIGSSPTYYLDNKPYNGGMDEKSLTRALCAKMPENAVCKALPPEQEVKISIVNDKACKACDASLVITQLKTIFSKLTVTNIEYNSDEGKRLLGKFNMSAIPLFVFDSSVTKHDMYEQMSFYLKAQNDEYMLRVQPVKYLGREEKKKHVDLFVMSQCPYGTLAEAALIEITKAIPELGWNVYFIAGEGEAGFDSLHGQPEVDEDIRQACMLNQSNDKYLDYLACANKNYTKIADVWESCATKAGMDAAKIKSCATTDEGKALLRANIKLVSELNARASPTMLLNNQVLINGIYAEPIKQAICSANSGMAGCEKTLSGQEMSSAPSGACG